jgi:AcrR family transcriptional regulator
MGELADRQEARRYHHGDLRRALVAQAVRVVEERGIEGLNLREISRMVGVSHSAAYHHFADKATLMTAITEEAFRLLGERLRPCLQAPGSAVDRLTLLGVAYVHFAYEHRGYFLVMWRPELRSAELEEVVREAGAVAYETIRTAVYACHEEAGSLPYQPTIMTMGAWSMAHGIASLTVDGPLARLFPTVDEVDKLAETIIRATAESIYGPGPRQQGAGAARRPRRR